MPHSVGSRTTASTVGLVTQWPHLASALQRLQVTVTTTRRGPSRRVPLGETPTQHRRRLIMTLFSKRNNRPLSRFLRRARRPALNQPLPVP